MPDQPRPPVPWRCLSPYCCGDGSWWQSVTGIIQCSHCRSPSLPDVVARRGTASDAPLVLADRTTTPAQPPIHGEESRHGRQD